MFSVYLLCITESYSCMRVVLKVEFYNDGDNIFLLLLSNNDLWNSVIQDLKLFIYYVAKCGFTFNELVVQTNERSNSEVFKISQNEFKEMAVKYE